MNYIFTWQSAEDVHNVIWVGIYKTSQTSGLYSQLEKLITCLHGPGV